ncbi:MAG TPA: nucleotidyl transferase AbiEii/AbiGii toxin family protein [Gemmataceae bacterium]|nr:nucleotidyl transferase AbiEii/AbiGii toxin family protein [Gemmataceae bacterium]
MPLTPFQKEVLLLLAAHRNPESHAGGGAVINRAQTSPRYSADLDLFHDVADRVLASAEADTAALTSQGLTVRWLLRQPFLQRAEVSRGTERLRLDWCFDSAFRFFPVQPDPEFGYCLHPADLATNKALALAGRAEVRDFVDILYLHDNYLSLGAICWAACGKDQGFTPSSLLEGAARHMKFREEDLASEHLARPISLPDLKAAWLIAVAQAEALLAKLPAADVGCLYLDRNLAPCTPDPSAPDFPQLTPHFGSVRGAWPVVS